MSHFKVSSPMESSSGTNANNSFFLYEAAAGRNLSNTLG
jgi:hypothetical protein